MFDIGFWEIVLISVIGLIVLGPERLPIAIRSVMRWINTAKSMANSVKTEISHELKLHEMNEHINKAGKHELSDFSPELKQSVDEIKQTAREISAPYEKKKKADRKQTVTLSKQKNTTPDTAKTTQNEQDKTDEYK